VERGDRQEIALFPKRESLELGRRTAEGEHWIDGEFIALRSPVFVSDRTAFFNNDPARFRPGFGFGFGGTPGICGGDLAGGSAEKYAGCDWDTEFEEVTTFWWWMNDEICTRTLSVGAWRWE